ncbi:glycosyltransferase [Sorangium sp. So ce118]
MPSLHTSSIKPKVWSPAEAFHLEPRHPLHLRSPILAPEPIEPSSISIVVPVRNNQEGVDRFLDTLDAETASEHCPCEVIIVDNRSDRPVEVRRRYPFPVNVRRCERPGPAAARNAGVEAARGSWLLFTDSDCIATPSLVAGYCTSAVQGDCFAYAGMVEIVGDSEISRHYREQNIFIPFALGVAAGIEPIALVTANCLVWKSAFTALGGFDERFILAGGEDTELGLRLRRAGRLEYRFESVARHEIDDGIEGFVSRFVRYGKGNKLLESLYVGASFAPLPPARDAATAASLDLEWLQFRAMSWGYEGKSSEDFPI